MTIYITIIGLVTFVGILINFHTDSKSIVFRIIRAMIILLAGIVAIFVVLNPLYFNSFAELVFFLILAAMSLIMLYIFASLAANKFLSSRHAMDKRMGKPQFADKLKEEIEKTTEDEYIPLGAKTSRSVNAQGDLDDSRMVGPEKFEDDDRAEDDVPAEEDMFERLRPFFESKDETRWSAEVQTDYSDSQDMLSEEDDMAQQPEIVPEDEDMTEALDEESVDEDQFDELPLFIKRVVETKPIHKTQADYIHWQETDLLPEDEDRAESVSRASIEEEQIEPQPFVENEMVSEQPEEAPEAETAVQEPEFEISEAVTETSFNEKQIESPFGENAGESMVDAETKEATKEALVEEVRTELSETIPAVDTADQEPELDSEIEAAAEGNPVEEEQIEQPPFVENETEAGQPEENPTVDTADQEPELANVIESAAEGSPVEEEQTELPLIENETKEQTNEIPAVDTADQEPELDSEIEAAAEEAPVEEEQIEQPPFVENEMESKQPEAASAVDAADQERELENAIEAAAEEAPVEEEQIEQPPFVENETEAGQPEEDPTVDTVDQEPELDNVIEAVAEEISVEEEQTERPLVEEPEIHASPEDNETREPVSEEVSGQMNQSANVSEQEANSKEIQQEAEPYDKYTAIIAKAGELIEQTKYLYAIQLLQICLNGTDSRTQQKQADILLLECLVLSDQGSQAQKKWLEILNKKYDLGTEDKANLKEIMTKLKISKM